MTTSTLAHLCSHIVISVLLVLSWGCVHQIQVAPIPSAISPTPLTQSLQVRVPFLAIEGADHMPGIPLLEWPSRNLRTAIINYAHARHTFARVSLEPSDLLLTVNAWLTMRSRDAYHYTLRLESTLSTPPLMFSGVLLRTDKPTPQWNTVAWGTPLIEVRTTPLDEALNTMAQKQAQKKSELIASYLVEKNATGSIVRWVTTSDQAPIAETVQAALDALFTQIEDDRALISQQP